jgi:hypothetical protein
MPALQLGSQENAILYLQQSQTDPQKAVAELVENSIDARARKVTITRERKGGHICLSILDDGEGVPADAKGDPDMERVATRIGDSIKRKLSEEGREGVQGQFGIGLLGFAAVGEEFSLRSRREGSKTREIRLRAFDTDYEPTESPEQLPGRGTQAVIRGVRRDVQNRLTAEKLQRYLSEELRDRVRQSGVRIVIEDRVGAHKTLSVTPREFSGRSLATGQKEISTAAGRLKLDLYAAFPKEGERALVSLARNGTRLLADIQECEELRHSPWDGNALEGVIDLGGLNPSPATRRGFLPDKAYETLIDELKKLEPSIQFEVDELRKRFEENVGKEVLEKLKQAFSEAMEELSDDYTWFEKSGSGVRTSDPRQPGPRGKPKAIVLSVGPLEEVRVAPKIAVIGPEETRLLSAKCFDPDGALIPSGVSLSWWTSSTLISMKPSGPVARVESSSREGEALVRVTARLKGVERVAEAKVVITRARNQFGFPPPDLVAQPLESWRSKYSAERGVLEVNSGHRDYDRAKKAGSKSEIRYLSKLYAKELVLLNMSRAPASQLLESMIELTSLIEMKL